MKHIYKLLPILMLVGIMQASAQQRGCGATEYLQQQIAADPSRGLQLEQIEEFTKRYVAENPSGTRLVVTIPVVVHVVYNTTAQNVSDALVQAQIDVLNQDFRKLNSDWTNTPSLFTNSVADCQIEFCLAKRDPNGNPTTGITRTQTSVSSFSSNDNIKRTANGGKDPWPSSSYLNFWLGNLSGGLLGYAQFPGGSSLTDGVVCLYSSVPGGTATNYNKGRTATHEVGHWLNLRHIWGDSNCGNDQVSDTPTQQTSNGGCPAFPHPTCSNTSDMYMNYMDYTYDACMYMFTNGQATRMSALFATGGSRASLLNSLGCVPVDATLCAVPTSLSSSGVTTTAATLSWAAAANATSYNLQYKTSASAIWTTVNTASTSYALSGLTANTTYNFQVQTVCASGSSNYSSASSFTTQQIVTGCSDTYEANNSRTAAKVIPVNTTINALISPSGDADWFRFSNSSSASKIKATLTNLAGDYDMKLYRSSSLLATSELGGTSSETIKYNTSTVSTSYYIYVYGYNGANSATQCYNLNVSLSSSNWREMDQDVTFEHVEFGDFDIYPNPTTGKFAMDYLSEGNQELQVYIIDMMGRNVLMQSSQVFEGPNTLFMDMNDLSNGMYMVMVKGANGESSKRVMLQR